MSCGKDHLGNARKRWVPLPAEAVCALAVFVGVPLIAIAVGWLLPMVSRMRQSGWLPDALAVAVVAACGVGACHWRRQRKGRGG